MSDQHADRAAITIRGPEELFDAARTVLDARNLDMRGFVVACLAALASRTDPVLTCLAPDWPPPKPLGQPRPFAGVIYAFRRVDDGPGGRWHGQPGALPDGQYGTATMDFNPVAPNRFTGQLEVRHGDVDDALLPSYYAFTTVAGQRMRPTAEVHEILFGAGE